MLFKHSNVHSNGWDAGEEREYGVCQCSSIGLFQIAPFTPFLSPLKWNFAPNIQSGKSSAKGLSMILFVLTHSALPNIFYSPCSMQNWLEWHWRPPHPPEAPHGICECDELSLLWLCYEAQLGFFKKGAETGEPDILIRAPESTVLFQAGGRRKGRRGKQGDLAEEKS